MRILAAVATVLIVTPAFAADDSMPKPAKPPKEKKICHPAEASGTRLGPRQICKTSAEWNVDRAAQQRDLDKLSRGN